MNVPSELDTFQSWIDYDDTYCGHERKYRFSKSDYQLIQESGFMYNDYPDSSYRMTISHIERFEKCRGLELDGYAECSERQLAAKLNREEFVAYGEEEGDLNGHSFYLMKFKTNLAPKQVYPSTLLQAYFFVDSVMFKVQFECASFNCDGFLDRMDKSFRSVRISANQ